MILTYTQYSTTVECNKNEANERINKYISQVKNGLFARYIEHRIKEDNKQIIVEFRLCDSYKYFYPHIIVTK